MFSVRGFNRPSPALQGRLGSHIRQGRRETVYKMLAKRRGGIVPCFVCGLPVSKEDASLEHIKPRSKGGTDQMSNLSISHRTCNKERGNNENYKKEPTHG